MARQTLDQWIRDALNDPDKDGKCTSIALTHVVQGKGEQEIHTIKLGVKPWEPKEMADLLRMKAEHHASEIPGVQTFNLIAFYAGRGEPQARKPFMVHGEHSTELGQLATEGPTGTGIIQQSMRHNEAVIQTAFRQIAIMTEAQGRQNQQLMDMNIRLMSENRDMFDILRQRELEGIERVRSQRMDELKYTRETEERSRLLGIAPSMINRVFQREVIPEKTADDMLLETLADSLTEEGITKIAATGAIKPEIWAPLAARMAQSLEKKRRAQDEARQLMNGADPETELQ